MRFENAAELVQRLGNIPLERICFTPPPGTATMRDLRAALRRSDRLYELVDGTLVEKPMGLNESVIASQIIIEVGVFARQHDLGICAGEAGTVRLLKGLVRIFPERVRYGRLNPAPATSPRQGTTFPSGRTWLDSGSEQSAPTHGMPRWKVGQGQSRSPEWCGS